MFMAGRHGAVTLSFPVGPTISIPRQPATVGVETSLLCHVGGFFPVDVNVVWLRDGQVQKGFTISSTKRKLDETFILTLNYTFTPDLHDSGSVFSCLVHHEVLGQSLQEDVTLDILGPTWHSDSLLPPAPTISTQRQQGIADAETSLLCHVGGFLPKDVDVEWLRDGQILNGSSCSSPQRNPDGTFSLTLTYTFSPTHSDAGSIFSCRVHHKALQQPLQEDVYLKIQGLLRPPQVSEISRTGSMAMGKGVFLSCHIMGHFPGELSVTWLWRDKGEATAVILWDSAECRVEPGTAVLARDGKSFQQETRLILLSPEDQGAEYMCRVGHLTLETPIERSSGKCWDGTGPVAVAG
ncbi:tyrosine-protein phosphatase non-receptor type substrate 1-like [Alligator mississippiensis]|uniref:Tyrosine-protein phosphatase non-receptor type substrate 1-like n=1 Tax=Alligator mississippiensis TaxID=8496 RepID=A0A151NQK6_ALLMI|nr:tyrosine-protein phosphatase non-receptor type substrate 1-like [Alligator mississippiensis]